jgi:CEP19-like protein
VDLNKLPTAEIELIKLHMDRQFHMLKPGEEGFEYDKEVEYPDPELSNEWDKSMQESIDFEIS